VTGKLISDEKRGLKADAGKLRVFRVPGMALEFRYFFKIAFKGLPIVEIHGILTVR
jgi:hypothetical protein